MSADPRHGLNGQTYGNGVYRDAVRMMRAMNTNASLVLAPVLTPAELAALLTSQQIANPTTGIVRLGPSDELTFAAILRGADNVTANIRVAGLYPIVLATEADGATITGWFQRPLLTVTATASALQLDAEEATILGGSTAANDRYGDTFSITEGENDFGGASNQRVLFTTTTGDTGIATQRIELPGAVYARIITSLGTASHCGVLGLRSQGNAQAR